MFVDDNLKQNKYLNPPGAQHRNFQSGNPVQSNAGAPQEGVHRINRMSVPAAAHTGNQSQQSNYSPVPMAQNKRKPPLPAPFMTKLEGSHSKLALYQGSSGNGIAGNNLSGHQNQNQSKQTEIHQSEKLQYQLKHPHQISQGTIPTLSQIQQSQQQTNNEEEMRATLSKIKPKISKKLPKEFAHQGFTKVKSKKHFQQFREQEQQKQDSQNFYLERIDNAVASEEYKYMQNLLKPIELDRDRVAQSKVDRHMGGVKFRDDFAKLMLPNDMQGNGGLGQGKQPLSQSSGFSTFDNFSLKLGAYNSSEPLRLDQMVTLQVFKSTSGTIKKMLHGPSLKIYSVKEVPLANRETRQILKEWMNQWENSCTIDSFVRIHDTFWNSPEGCVSVVQDFAAKGSLLNMVESVGALPESALQHLARQIVKGIENLHNQGMTHSNITTSQIVFDRRGKVRLSPGYGHILRYKSETQTTLNQHNTLTTLLCEGTWNYANRLSLLKDKFNHLCTMGGGAPPLGSMGNIENSINELKKIDLFDLGLVLLICATDGFNMVHEEYLEKLCDWKNQCCISHAVAGLDETKPGFDPTHRMTLITLKHVLARISPGATDFICQCMQQRFTEQELANLRLSPKKEIKNIAMMNWLQPEKRVLKDTKLHFKELLQISHNDGTNNKGAGIASASLDEHNSPVSAEYQLKQIERIVEAIALTLPPGVSGHSLGGLVGTQSTANLDSNNTASQPNMATLANPNTNTNSSQHYAQQYRQDLVRELATELGVDSKVLQKQLQSVFHQIQ